jgi:3-hydroxy-3-methylglutaryl CoA synthase
MQRSAGIVACGAYLPRSRLERAAIAAATGWAGAPRSRPPAGQRSYCNWDEDSVTMAVEAARDCLQGRDRTSVRWAGFASTTAPFADRSNAGVVATALDLPEATATFESAGSQRAGTAALLAALDWAATGRDGFALVTTADRRLARPGSPAEQAYGHGAASLLVGSGGDVIAVEVGRHSLQDDFVDHYRAEGADFDYSLEERWVRDEGYLKLLPKALHAALERAGVAPGEVSRFVANCPAAVAKSVAKLAGLPEQSVGDDLRAACGDLGVPHALFLLGAALETAVPGRVIVLATFGQGCDVLVLRATARVTERRARQGASQALASGAADCEYVRYLAHSGLIEMDWGLRAERDNRTAPSVAWRKHRDVTAFTGGRCRACGTVQFPKARACVNPECRAFDTQDDHALAEARGKVKTFTEDWLAFTRSPPHVYGNVAIDDGCNVFTEFCDTAAGELAVGAAVRFMFRVKDLDAVRGFRRYFWKATPVRS